MEYVFYEKKSKIALLFLLGCVFIALALFLVSEEEDSFNYYFLLLFLPFFGYATIKLFLKLLSRKPYVEVNSAYIKVADFEELPWSDITGMVASKYFWMLEVKDTSKYRLSLLQKVNMKCGFTPFFINTTCLSKEDDRLLEDILSAHVSDIRYEPMPFER